MKREREPQQSPDFPDSFYRVSIKGMCVRDGKLLLAHEHESVAEILGGAWELPGGGLDFGEHPHEALLREVREEMGLTVSNIADRPIYVWTNLLDQLRGFDWYYSVIVAYRFEVKDLDITPSEECEYCEFFSKEQLSEIPLGFQMKKLPGIFDPKDFA